MDDLERLTLWRVGHESDPTGFSPRAGYQYSHRFDDDAERGWRTVYCAWQPETALREVMADLRPNLAARARFVARYGPGSDDELPPDLVPADWRRGNVLAAVRIVRETTCRVLDLTDAAERHRLELRHAELLVAHDMSHLDLNEITTRRRDVTRRIAATAYDEDGTGVIRYPSSIDGQPCYAVMEGRARLEPSADPVVLTDPAPEPLQNVAAGWQLKLGDAPALVRPRSAGAG